MLRGCEGAARQWASRGVACTFSFANITVSVQDSETVCVLALFRVVRLCGRRGMGGGGAPLVAIGSS